VSDAADSRVGAVRCAKDDRLAPWTDDSDQALIAAVAQGDHASFDRLYLRHAAACGRRAAGVLAAADWVDDVLQAVFLDLWRHADRFDDRRGSVRAWLLTLTHHKAIDLVRSQERHNRLWAAEHLLAAHADPSASPEAVCAAADTAARVRAAVDQMSAPGRAAVVACFLTQQTQREAAVSLGVPLGTIKTHSSRGVRELRGLVELRSLWD
jgi:RNA polymerase sigma-70 factor (ECF subfamily)